MRKVERLDGKIEKLRLGDEKGKIGAAFQLGANGHPKPNFIFQFEEDASQRGREQSARIREEIKSGQR